MPEHPLSQSYEFYNARANEAAAEADKATLANVRDRNRRAEKTWRGLADQAGKVKADRDNAKAEREAKLQAQAEEEEQATQGADSPAN